MWYWSAVNFYANLQVIRDKAVKLRILELQPVQDGTTPVERKTMMPFPQTKAGPVTMQTYFSHMFCTCQIHAYDDMVECDTCGDWYHLKCVSLEQFPAEGEQWNCNKCMGWPNSLFGGGYQKHWRGSKIPRDLTRGCQILEGARSPMTPGLIFAAEVDRQRS